MRGPLAALLRQARLRRLAAVGALLGDDDLVVGFQFTLDDFGVGVVVEAGGHCDPNCFAVAQHPDPALLGRTRSAGRARQGLSLIHISEPTRLGMISYA